jgi:hypothetical protein
MFLNCSCQWLFNETCKYFTTSWGFQCLAEKRNPQCDKWYNVWDSVTGAKEMVQFVRIHCMCELSVEEFIYIYIYIYSFASFWSSSLH